ncbi:UDP-glucosyltransferase 2-like [Anthonomus grandis grandis]|uniref:UDP-glucosyltransferase 2-like n=1 Tax=Anthonomus grandis grandis TaxID=2921223 RepID=UPI002166BD5C|nr:UDP-glucosyltransferase 2-like [Anthonomus grandis grandis]XP_050311788.1 UDP-glucosyltransferase 2-like [Anthonomus grandis grandis]XP_050311789.1 UDP-glucosyltransferase 2-like [Anthonomus grandis grandis]
MYLLVLFTFCYSCHAANILVYYPTPFYSHQVTYRPLYRELANRGHQLTLITPNPTEPHPNITQIDVGAVYKFLNDNKFYELVSSGEQSFGNIVQFFRLMTRAIDMELNHPEVRRLIRGNERYDLVLAEYLVTAGTAFAHKFQCPMIALSSMDTTSVNHQLLGNPAHPLLYPPQDAGFIGKPTFGQRILSTLGHLVMIVIEKLVRQSMDTIVKKHFGADTPPLEELEQKINFFFINTNPVFYTARPLGLQTINLGGGLHFEPPKPLPTDFKEFLDNSEEGVIYFSLGSTIRSAHIDSRSRQVILEVLGRLPYDVLWKFENDQNDTVVLPKNVRVSKWVPQQDVLRHPRVKCFITQGGLQSLEESLYAGVPVLILPFFGDQFQNSAKAVRSGIGLELDHKNLETESFEAAILELIQSDKYRMNARQLVQQLLDQPMSGLERAVWWTEYALRNRNVDVLRRPLNYDMPLYQYLFLDVIFCCLGALVVLVWLLFKTVGLVRGFVLRRRQKVKRD